MRSTLNFILDKLKTPNRPSDGIDLGLGQLSMECGVSKSLWLHGFEPTLAAVARSHPKLEQDYCALIHQLTWTMARRRAYNLPVDADPEDIHSAKDRWTFVVFILGLWKAIPECDISHTLNLIPPKMKDWLQEDRRALAAISSICQADLSTLNARCLAKILQIDENSNKFEPQHSIQAPEPASLRSCNDSPDSISALVEEAFKTNEPEVTSKREAGRLFLRELTASGSKLSRWTVSEGESVLIETPKAFMEFGRTTGIPWKKVQSGVQKLRVNVLDEGNQAFYVVRGKTFMKVSLDRVKECLKQPQYEG